MNDECRQHLGSKARWVVALLACSLFGVQPMAAENTPDFTGVWRVKNYSPALTTADGAPVPLLPEAAAVYEKRRAAARRGDYSFDPAETCLAPGMPRFMTMDYPFEIVQRPHRLVFLYEGSNTHRRVDLSGTSAVIDYPVITGVSVGHWEGDTLVVETTGLVNTTLLDDVGMPHSESLRLTERLRLIDGGRTLENRIRFEDPDVFERPWETVVLYRRVPNYILKENICLDRKAAGEAPLNRGKR
jgi:hypothetical protein